MANEREIKILINADGSAAIAGIRNVGTEVERLGARGASALDSFKQNWISLTAGITAAYLAVQKALSFAELAAQHEEAMASLDAMTRQYGMTAEGLVGIIGENSKGLIGQAAAARIAGDALMKGLGPEQLA